MSERPTTLRIECPDCGSTMVVDAATGETLEHKPAKSGERKHDFDTLLAEMDSSKAKAEAVFQQELSALEDRSRLMDEKFKRALERAEREDDGKAPERPWDFD